MTGLFDSTTTSSTAPWSGAQPYLTNIMQQAQGGYQGAGIGPGTFKASNIGAATGGVAAMDPNTTAALQQISQISGQGNPLAGQSMQNVQALGQGGTVSNYLNNLYGQVGQQYGGLANQYQQQYGQIGSQYGGLENQYQQLYNQAGNPYFEQALQGQVDLLGNDIQRQFGGLGRSGSAADTGALAQQIGNVRTQALSNQWNQNIANQQAILGGLSGAYGTQNQLQQSALGGLGTTYGNQNQLQSGILGQQASNYLNAAQAAPGAYAQQYLPAEYQMGVGQAYQQQAQQVLSAQRAQQEQNRQAKAGALGQYTGTITRAAGGTGTTTTQQNPSVAQYALAGATAAAPFLKYLPAL